MDKLKQTPEYDHYLIGIYKFVACSLLHCFTSNFRGSIELMKLILLRHGLREPGFGDISLSLQGFAHAEQLKEAGAFQDIQVILASPKKRAQQTVAPAADKLGLTMKIEIDLDQRKSVESQQEFEHRAQSLMSHFAETYKDQNVLACSHSDWLQVAILGLEAHINDAATHCLLSCAEYKVLQYKQERWSLL